MKNAIKHTRMTQESIPFKKNLLYLAVFLFAGWGQTGLFAQTCSIGDVTLQTQADVDNFQVDYGPCTAIMGKLRIDGGYQIFNLNGLSDLTSIENLFIENSHSLTNLDGLSSLTKVEGTFYIDYARTLANVDGLSKLTEVGHLGIDDCPKLTDLDGLSNLKSVGNLIIMETGIINVNGLSNLRTIEGYVGISENFDLANLNGLSNLTYVGGDLSVANNEDLSACCGLYNLLNGGTVGGSIQMWGNDDNCNDNGAAITPAACAPPYVLVATDGFLEFDECIDHYGGLGIMSAGDRAEIEDDAVVTAPGTFVKAPRIDVDGSSSVATLIYDQANPYIPTFRANNFDEGDDVDVDDDETVVLTKSIYDDIRVDDDATIIFSGHSDVYIDNLETEDDVTILFDQCTNLMIQDRMELGKDGRFNASNTQNVTVFAGDEIIIKRRNVVYGIFYSQDRIYTQSASSDRTTKMHGLFIGEDVEANEHGEYWAQNFKWVCGTSAPAAIADEQPLKEDLQETVKIDQPGNSNRIIFRDTETLNEFTLYPNPANSILHLRVRNRVEKPAVIRIFNMQGKMMVEERYRSLEEQGTNFEVNQLGAGIYTLMIVIEGDVPLTKKFTIQK